MLFLSFSLFFICIFLIILMTKLSLDRPIVFIDVETTGLNTQQDRIVDICATKIFPDGREDSLNSLINPTISISAEATNVHGITNEDVKNKPTFAEFASQLFDFINDCGLAGFGVIKFDFLILESEFKRAGITFSKDSRQIIDVQSIYHKLEPRDLNAAHLKYCGRALENAHRAYSDVKATIDVLEAQLKHHPDLPHDISSLNEFCNPRDPTWIDRDGKFAWCRSDAVINFGAHKGKTLHSISKDKPDYLQWIIRSDFSEDVKQIAEDALNGKFPTGQE